MSTVRDDELLILTQWASQLRNFIKCHVSRTEPYWDLFAYASTLLPSRRINVIERNIMLFWYIFFDQVQADGTIQSIYDTLSLIKTVLKSVSREKFGDKVGICDHFLCLFLDLFNTMMKESQGALPGNPTTWKLLTLQFEIPTLFFKAIEEVESSRFRQYPTVNLKQHFIIFCQNLYCKHTKNRIKELETDVSSFIRAHGRIHNQKSSPQCFQCKDSSDPQMMKCGGCRLAFYCSVSCAKAHYMHHKTICRRHRQCKVCGIKSNIKKCRKCESVFYCSSQCQEEDWEEHKDFCNLPS